MKDIDKIRACAMVIVTISCFAKKRHGIRVCKTRRRLMYTRADPGTAWDRGRCVHCPAVGGAMVVFVVAVTDISRNFCEQFFLLLLDLGIGL